MNDIRNQEREDSTRTEETPALLPPVDVIEDSGGITLYADLPGVPKEQLTLQVDTDTLTIAGNIVLPLIEGLESTHAEVASPRYHRSFTLSRELDTDRVGADFNHGVLRVRIPKKEHALPRKIAVAVG